MDDFGEGARALWEAVTATHDLDAVQRVQLVEACRIKDRCDWLDGQVRENPGNPGAADEGERLGEPDSAAAGRTAAAGRRGQEAAVLRPRGAQCSTVPGGKVSSPRPRQGTQGRLGVPWPSRGPGHARSATR